MSSISFIIPTFNNKNMVIRSIESIYSQIENGDEIIIIDDGSTDGSFVFLSQKYLNYSNIKIIQQKNSGSGAARNNGVKLSGGEFLWFVDSDDYIVNGAVKKIKNLIREHKYDLLLFDFYLNNEEKNNIQKININVTDKITMLLSYQVPWNKIIQKSLFENVYFPEGRIRYQDHGTMPIIISKAKSIYYLEEPMYIYDFTHPNNIGKNLNKNDDIYIAFENLIEANNKQIIKNNHMEALFISTFVYAQIYNPSKNDFQTIYRNVKKVKKYLQLNYQYWKKSKFLSMSFTKKYNPVVNKLFFKIVIGKIFTFNNLVPALFVYCIKRKIRD